MFTFGEKKEDWMNVGYFTMVFVAVFAVTYGVLYWIGWIPVSLGGPARTASSSDDYWIGDYELIDVDNYDTGRTRPDRIIIDKVGVDTIVEKPTTRDVAALDQYLTRGAVHYPGSGTVEQGNMFLFGHSTGLRVVQNQAFKTFNGLENLIQGDEIIVEADGRMFIYKVDSVELLDEDDALITFDNSSRRLTLSTCNTFGAKQERWVVEAEFDREV
jgi:LPXTG-site transpeptidase (sortase) family protein